MKALSPTIKSPCRIWLLAVALSIGQSAFSSGTGSNDRPTEQSITQEKKVSEITGTVTDSSGPVIGATVSVKGTTNGVITDIDGNFKLKVPEKAILLVSYIGYANKEVHYKGEKHIKITLEENVQQLEEVQVIAYGAQKKVTITGEIGRAHV